MLTNTEAVQNQQRESIKTGDPDLDFIGGILFTNYLQCLEYDDSGQANGLWNALKWFQTPTPELRDNADEAVRELLSQMHRMDNKTGGTANFDRYCRVLDAIGNRTRAYAASLEVS